ncbi:hypothetical protein [Glycomyces albidus]|uniref:hypothetical protein n=1 Tax=Glycomyces albidus TaxID=2656774 RepID=UPI0012900F61|nr:hypothetical protein [Glycomyces albidus]
MISTWTRRLVAAAAAGLLAVTAFAAPAQADDQPSDRASRTVITLGDGGWP